MTQPFSTFATFDTNNIQAGDRQEKQVPAKPGQPSTGKYNEIPLFYKYDSPTPGTPQIISSLRIEFPEVYSNGGIVEKVGQSGRPEWTVMIRLPQTGETQALTNTLHNLHKGCAVFLNAIKGAVGMYEFNVQAPSATGFKSPVVLSRDKTTGEVRQGFDPSLYLKLMKRGYAATEEKTLFKSLGGKTLDWEILKGVELKFIPLMEFEKIYIGGGKASIQCKMISAIVTSVVKKNTETTQISTMENIKQARPEAVSQLEEQIRKLMLIRSELITQTTTPVVTGVPDQGTPPVVQQVPQHTGLTPLPAAPQQQSPPQLQQTTVPAVPTMQAFLQQAPVMPAMPGVAPQQFKISLA